MAAARTCARDHGQVRRGTLAPRRRRWSKKRAARWGRPCVQAMSAMPRSPVTKWCHVVEADNRSAANCAYLRNVNSAGVNSVVGVTRAVGSAIAWECSWGLASSVRRGRFGWDSPCAPPCHGGALRSQGAIALSAAAPWPPRQVPLAAAAVGAMTRWARTWARRRPRSLAFAKGRWVARRPQSSSLI
jgi:hypothetical protein